MNFKETNRYFISSMNTRLKELSPEDRKSTYLRDFYKPMHERIDIAYQCVQDIQSLTDFYGALLLILDKDELEWVLLSIFFEEQADIIISGLWEAFEAIGRDRLSNTILGSEIFHRELTYHDGSLVKGYLKSFFGQYLEISERDWREENTTRNPLINSIEFYLRNTIKEEPEQVEMLKKIIIHFAKLWQIYYRNPFSFAKGRVLLYKIISGYQQVDKLALKVDLYQLFDEVQNQKSNLLPKMSEFPLEHRNLNYEDLTAYTDTQKNQYEIEKQTFFEILVKDQIYFSDLSKLSISQLIINWNAADAQVESAYIRELSNREKRLQLPSSEDLSALSELHQRQDFIRPPVKTVLTKIIKDNYIFF